MSTNLKKAIRILIGLTLALPCRTLAAEPEPAKLINGSPEDLARTLAELTSQNYVVLQSVERNDVTIDLAGVATDQIDLPKMITDSTPYQLRFASGIWFILDDSDRRSLEPFQAGPKRKRPVSLDVADAALPAVLQLLSKAWDKPFRLSALDGTHVTVRMIDVPADVALTVIATKYSLVVRETTREVAISAQRPSNTSK